MIETAALNQLLFDAFTGKMTWLAASRQYSLPDFIDAFHRTRATMQKTLEDVTDAQVAYQAPTVPTWSLSETVTHLVYSQSFYYNALLEITSSQLPHIAEAARGFGEGSKQNIAAAVLRQMLLEATVLIDEGLAKTAATHDPTRVTRNPFFGDVDYATWVLLMLGHEVDHVRQSIVVRRLARAALPVS